MLSKITGANHMIKNNIFRPLEKHEKENYKKIKSEVFKKYKSNHYTEKSEILEVCYFIYNKHEENLLEYIHKLPPLDLVEFALYQYEQYAEFNTHHHNFNLSTADEEMWVNYGSYSRRGIKYLLEYLCENHEELNSINHSPLNDDEISEALSIIFISLEEMCSMYMRIQSYEFIIEDVELYLDEEKYTYFTVPQDDHPENRLDIRMERKKVRSYIESIPFNIDISLHSNIFGDSFNEHLGISYEKLINILLEIITNSPSNIAIVNKNEMIDFLCKKLNIDINQANSIVLGFSIDQERLKIQVRKLFAPKQEYRAYHRGFFIFKIKDEECIIFSKTMAKESLDILLNNVCYKILPKEWLTNSINSKLATLSNMAGKWYEEQLFINLKKTDIKTIRSVKKLKSNDKIVTIPDNVGEIDFLGFDLVNSSLFIIEAKNVRFNTEPRLFRDDLSKFTHGSKSYSNKFNKKCQWVIDNINIITDEFKRNKININNIAKIYKVMVLFHPSIIETKKTDFTCMNMVKFLDAVQRRDYNNIKYIINHINLD
ncbi:hypothetical protein RC90_00555 [Pectobacterium brasiliense]|uniref:hypothetical protein n=1 Tax=Pectobacterium brasiliense TaxID=180957 RepID=UPI0004E63F22|nr:hypothetical protein [Pectobacterium brasiliense]KFF64896.1 hypothetical protein IV99_12095 [Pectobacterium brasiliense]KHT01498.1 hypothetical protein RC90_00555 [Pectobacterium brasiliense]